MTIEKPIPPIDHYWCYRGHQYNSLGDEFPDGIPVTVDAIMRASKLGVDIDFTIADLLSPAKVSEYRRVKAETLVRLMSE